MGSKRDHEGYFALEHRGAPMPEHLLVTNQLPPEAGVGLYESATFTCAHSVCGGSVVIINKRRTRERAWCRHCDHYLCDRCGAQLARDGICRNLKAELDRLQNAISKAADAGRPIQLVLPPGV